MLLGGALFFSGCAHMATTRSGFLSDYARLKPSPSDKRRLFYSRSDWPKTEFSKVFIEPTTTRLGAADEKKISAKESSELAAHCDATLKKTLATHRLLVAAPAADTLRVRAAITGLDTSSRTLNLVTGVLLWPVDNGGVTLEFEVLDSITNEQLVALVAFSEGTPLQVIGSFSKLGHARSGVEYWVAELNKLIDPQAVPNTPPK
jgi:hypothetical protein